MPAPPLAGMMTRLDLMATARGSSHCAPTFYCGFNKRLALRCRGNFAVKSARLVRRFDVGRVFISRSGTCGRLKKKELELGAFVVVAAAVGKIPVSSSIQTTWARSRSISPSRARRVRALRPSGKSARENCRPPSSSAGLIAGHLDVFP